jgi:hypothetical protein
VSKRNVTNLIASVRRHQASGEVSMSEGSPQRPKRDRVAPQGPALRPDAKLQSVLKDIRSALARRRQQLSAPNPPDKPIVTIISFLGLSRLTNIEFQQIFRETSGPNETEGNRTMG